MERNFKFVLVTILFCVTLLPFISNAQYSPAIVAGFGVDGDVLSGRSQNLTPSSTPNSFDWFKAPGNAAGVGVGVIDTTGSSVYKTRLQASENFTFNQGMAFPRYSVQNGYLLLDGRYGRDNIGISTGIRTGGGDSTTFIGGSKNGDNPSTWTTAPNGSTLDVKYDIVDSYIHMRRDGTTINNTNPSALILTMGVSTLGNTGNRYVDFELFHERITYNTSTGLFSNSGPASTGGRTEWTFNSNGSINTIGDMTVSFSYSTAGVSEVSIYIWVSLNTYSTVAPSKFKFVPFEFYGNTYGYAKIASISTNQYGAWASASTANTAGPMWGTSSNALGAGSISYSNEYAAYDFGEIAVDLTSLGVDPALSTSGFDACIPPFTRVITKTRSSSTFTSALQDFSGPYEFLDAPVASPAIATPGILKCNVTSTTLTPMNPVSGASYQWATSNGNIVSTNGSNAVVDKAGKYYLTSAIVAGCPKRTDSTTVVEDKFQPVASATSSGALVASNPQSTVTLLGGDPILSNVITPYGGSTGLNWYWTGPSSFVGNTKDVVVGLQGNYTLILTEQRNGCKDTAVVAVASLAASTLSVKYLSLNAVPVENLTVAVTWITSEEFNNNRFEIQRSFDLNSFKTIAIVLDGFAAGTQKSYAYNDKAAELQNRNVIYYRLKQVDNDGKYTFSEILTVKFKTETTTLMKVYPNPFAENINVRYNASKKGLAEISIIDANGKIVLVQQTIINIGFTNISINNLSRLNAGFYIARLSVNGIVSATEKIIKR